MRLCMESPGRDRENCRVRLGRVPANGRDSRNGGVVSQLSISESKKYPANQVDYRGAAATLRGLRRELPAGTMVSASQGAMI